MNIFNRPSSTRSPKFWEFVNYLSGKYENYNVWIGDECDEWKEKSVLLIPKYRGVAFFVTADENTQGGEPQMKREAITENSGMLWETLVKAQERIVRSLENNTSSGTVAALKTSNPNVQTLVSMGFAEDLAIFALQRTNGDVEKAVQICLNGISSVAKSTSSKSPPPNAGMDGDIVEFITGMAQTYPPVSVIDFRQQFEDIIGRKTSLQEVNLFLRLSKEREYQDGSSGDGGSGGRSSGGGSGGVQSDIPSEAQRVYDEADAIGSRAYDMFTFNEASKTFAKAEGIALREGNQELAKKCREKCEEMKRCRTQSMTNAIKSRISVF